MLVVINKCFGGFSLSNLAIKALCERKRIPCHFFTREGFDGPWTRISDDEAFNSRSVFGPSAFRCEDPSGIPNQGNWHNMSMEERAESNRIYSEVMVPYGRDLKREDVDLVAVVQTLGEKANGVCAKLDVVKIPDDVNWEIDEYDGNETIREVSRSWG